MLAGLGILLVNTQSTAMMPLAVELRLGAITAFDVLRQALTLVGVAVLALAGASLLPYFAVQVLVGVALLALAPRVLGGARALRPGLARQDAWRLVREALPVALAIAMNVVYLRLLVILVSLTQSEEETGLYATSFRIFEILIGIPTLLLAVALPLLAVAGDSDLERLRYGLQRMTEVAVVLHSGSHSPPSRSPHRRSACWRAPTTKALPRSSRSRHGLWCRCSSARSLCSR